MEFRSKTSGKADQKAYEGLSKKFMSTFGDQSLNVSMECEVIENNVVCPEIEIDTKVCSI